MRLGRVRQRHWLGDAEADQWSSMYSDPATAPASGDIPTPPTGVYDFNANLQPQPSAVDVTLGATSQLARVLGTKAAAKAPVGPSFLQTLTADPVRLAMLGLGGLLVVGGLWMALKKPQRRLAGLRRRR